MKINALAWCVLALTSACSSNEYTPRTRTGVGGHSNVSAAGAADVQATSGGALGLGGAAGGAGLGNAQAGAVIAAGSSSAAGRVGVAGNQSGAGTANATGGRTGVSSGGTHAAGSTNSTVSTSNLSGASAAGTCDYLPAVGTAVVAKPAGAVGGFKILDWAGFKGAVSFTHDDGSTSVASNYSKLQATGIRFTFFLMGDNASANRSVWQQAANDGHELGNHTQHHLQGNVAGSDAAGGQATIESLFGFKVYTMAAPYGEDYTTIAQSLYLMNRGISDGLMKPNNESSPSAFNTYCWIPNEAAPTSDFDAKVANAVNGGGWQVVLVHGFPGYNDGAWHPVALDQYLAAVTNAKQRGDVFVDSYVNVGAYWRGQTAVSKVQPTGSGSDQVYAWTLPNHFPPNKCLRATVTGGVLRQNGKEILWDSHGYYPISLDAGSVTLSAN